MKYKYPCNIFQLSRIENINESLQTHYLIYKITNNINGKYYIGQHKTNNPYDDYMGSGNLIKAACNKYQLSSFTKEILFDFDNFEDMNNKEKELVQLSNCFPQDPMSYNISEGGKQYKMNDTTKELLRKQLSEYQAKLTVDEKNEYSKKQKLIWENKSELDKLKTIEKCRNASRGKNNPMYGHSATEFMSANKIKQWKEHISQATKGKNNPMYGKSIKDFMTPEKYQQWKEKHKLQAGKNHPCYGTKMLYDLDGKRHYIKIEKCTIVFRQRLVGIKTCQKKPSTYNII